MTEKRYALDMITPTENGVLLLDLFIRNGLTDFTSQMQDFTIRLPLSNSPSQTEFLLYRFAKLFHLLFSLGFRPTRKNFFNIYFEFRFEKEVYLTFTRYFTPKVARLNSVLEVRLRRVASLKVLGRIAFRRSLGGVRFAVRLARHPHLPE